MTPQRPSRRPAEGRAESGGFVERDRGQTVLDYAIAAGIFFVALTFVLGFIPGMFAPFTGAETAQVADRYATSLSTDRLGHPSEPYLLNETCTEEFFHQVSGGDDAPSTCRYDTSGDTLEAVLGSGPGIKINVTIQSFDGQTVTLNGQDLVAGDQVPRSQGVTTARRAVRLDGKTYHLLVRVW